MYRRSNEQLCIGHLRLQICCCHKDHKDHGYFRPVVNIYRASTNSIGKYIRLGYSPTQDASVRERKAQGPRRLNLHANPRNYSI